MTDAALRSGMFANGRIALAASAPIAALPLTAVRNEAGQNFVWVVADGKLARRVVTLGRRDEASGLVEVKSALPADLPVLATRFENLKEGAPARLAALASGGPPSLPFADFLDIEDLAVEESEPLRAEPLRADPLRAEPDSMFTVLGT